MLLLSSVLLSLISVSQSAPLSCEDRLRPLDPPRAHQLSGRWVLVADSRDHPPSLEILRTKHSVSIVLTPGLPSDSDNTTANYLLISRFSPPCTPGSYNISLRSNGTFGIVTEGGFNLWGVFLTVASCPDCMAMRVSSSVVSLDLKLLSRRREVGEEAMEEYRAQLRCLGLPAPVVMDPRKSLCEEEETPPEPDETKSR